MTIDTYTRGINLIASDVHGYYLYNAHGDVVQLADGSGVVTKDYDYDAFGVQVDSDGSMRYTDVGDALFEDSDTNPWRYCGEYFDTETNTIYLRARYYNPALGRFLAEDTHWNIGNMVYGDNPVKWNERRSDEKDPLGLNSYTYKADRAAIIQSGNLYAYALSNPLVYIDPSGKVAILPAAIRLLERVNADRLFEYVDDVAKIVLEVLGIYVADAAIDALTGVYYNSYSNPASSRGDIPSPEEMYRNDRVARVGSKLPPDTGHILHSKHNWNRLVPDPKNNFDKVVAIITYVLTYGKEEPYKSVSQRTMEICGEIVTVTYKIVDGIIKISDAWVNR